MNGRQEKVEAVFKETMARKSPFGMDTNNFADAQMNVVQDAAANPARLDGKNFDAAKWAGINLSWRVKDIYRDAQRRPKAGIPENLSAREVEKNLLLADVAEQRELRVDLESVIARLPCGERDVLVLCDQQGFTEPEVAALLGVSRTTVSERRRKARRKCKEWLGPDFDPQPSRES